MNVLTTRVTTIAGDCRSTREDHLAIEEPLEIRVGYTTDAGRLHQTVSITMRTPGDDADLAAGFLFTEGLLAERGQIESIIVAESASTGTPAPSAAGGVARNEPGWVRESANAIDVGLAPDVLVDLHRLERHFYTSSSCGVCGKTSVDHLHSPTRYPIAGGSPQIAPALIHTLPETLRASQSIFDRTGGLHASALFDSSGTLLCLREDVGRHNALDKVIGSHFLADRLPLSDTILLVSGRASFELVQKAVMAGIPILAAVGAPSSLAVELARDAGMTLIGFVRGDRYNIYTGDSRIAVE